MKALLIYPEFPDTFWSFRHALKFIHRKASSPPLGLLTIAAMLPEAWEKRLVDMNVESLRDDHLRQADLVFVSAMSVQKGSVKEVLARCKAAGVRIVAGGPLFTTDYDAYRDVDHLVLNEAEITLPRFLEDLRNGIAGHIYTTDEWADIRQAPIPLWRLVNMNRYASINIQYSRGCPFNCEFCDITLLCGRTPRTKERGQIIRELESVYASGFRGQVFFVDDNFIGNKKKLKEEVLPAIVEWMERKEYPFSFNTQASIELSDHEDLMEMMVSAGFDVVFIGIESPHEQSLAECSKIQNRNRDLLASIRKIQRAGLEVQGGFIVGFDHDPVTIFDAQIRFIQASGIVTAMVGILIALPRTRLYQRLKKEHRLLDETSGNNTDFATNFIPKMDYDLLINGYKKILKTLYSPTHYYARVRTFLREYIPPDKKKMPFRFRPNYLTAFFRSIIVLGIVGKERFHYWRLLFWTLFTRPRLFTQAITLSIYGFHFRKVFQKHFQGSR
ncbi:MAG: B12-binding domain-containing radical SAM protein [Nitrospirae bacterium]|nr:B12-binding domain-containing radical SAM protein [Nitrospirota bacterium]NTW66515.1 B12-binding domain-containing radical SAM protein [Nitrospirota bacterium]